MGTLQLPEAVTERCYMKNFANLTGKHLHRSFLLIKLYDLLTVHMGRVPSKKALTFHHFCLLFRGLLKCLMLCFVWLNLYTYGKV